MRRPFSFGLAPNYFCIHINSVDIEFDPAKDAVNRDKHGVSLKFGADVFDDADCLLIPSLREIDGEARFKVVGNVDGKLWTAVHVKRGAVVRFISVRRSNDSEQAAYDRYSGRSQ